MASNPLARSKIESCLAVLPIHAAIVDPRIAQFYSTVEAALNALLNPEPTEAMVCAVGGQWSEAGVYCGMITELTREDA